MRKKIWTILLTVCVFLSGTVLGVSTVYRVGHTHASLYSLGGLKFDAEVATERLSIPPSALPAFDCDYTLTLGGEARRFAISMRLERSDAK